MRFIIERIAGRSVARMTVDGPLLRIGRGTNADLRSENPAVAFEHALIEAGSAGYTIRDHGSITGTYVNGRAVESAHLNRGDRIEIGDLRIEVESADPSEAMVLRLVEARASDAPLPAFGHSLTARGEKGHETVTAPTIDYARAFGLRRTYLTKVTVAGLLVVATLAVVGEVVKEEHQRAFMPGGLASAHARMRIACNQCHIPFRAVGDQQCQQCHRQPSHGQRDMEEPPCAACHAEHRGQMMLAAIPDGRCAGCHAKIEPAIRSFAGSHRDFAHAEDRNSLRFNHEVHLRAAGVRDGRGQVVRLECDSCHHEQIRFETHCRDCHRLTFDPRLPRAEIPHGGDPALVYGFVIASYAGDPDLMARSPVELRRMMTTRTGVSIDQRAMLNAEQVIKTKCRHCHEVTSGASGLEVTRPEITRHWFARAKFSHERHAQIACEQCHRDAQQSSETADVLLPSKNDCTRCHGPNDNMVASSCVTCHEYHRSGARR